MGELMKLLWAYLKKNNLQCDDNKQYFVPDKKMAKVFGTEKLRGFGMSKHIGAHLLQSDGSAQPAAKAKPAAKKWLRKPKKKNLMKMTPLMTLKRNPLPLRKSPKKCLRNKPKKKNLRKMKPVMAQMTPLKTLMTKEFAYEQFCTLVLFFYKDCIYIVCILA